MTYINWDKPFEIERGTATFSFPTYGNYGGADYSSGDFGQDPPLDQGGSYLSNKELDDNSDALDYLFYRHDVVSSLADSPAEQRAADVDLIRRIGDLSDKQLADPEASFYAGLATIGIGAQVLANDPSPFLIGQAEPFLEDALDNIETALSQFGLVEFILATELLTETVEALQEAGIGEELVDTIVDELGSFLGAGSVATAEANEAQSWWLV